MNTSYAMLGNCDRLMAWASGLPRTNRSTSATVLIEEVGVSGATVRRDF